MTVDHVDTTDDLPDDLQYDEPTDSYRTTVDTHDEDLGTTLLLLVTDLPGVGDEPLYGTADFEAMARALRAQAGKDTARLSVTVDIGPWVLTATADGTVTVEPTAAAPGVRPDPIAGVAADADS